jgi:hypothetical protein
MVMASRLPLHSITRVPWFIGLTVQVVRQLERTDGLLGYSLRAQPLAHTFWTLSAWRDEESLASFARALPHAAIIVRLRPHMDETRFSWWETPAETLPVRWDDAVRRLAETGVSPRPR